MALTGSGGLDRRIVVGAAVAAGGLIGGIVAIAVWMVPDRRDDIWIDLARAGIQLLVIIGLGGVVSLVLRNVEEAREQRRQRDERRFAIFEQLVTNYHRLKFVRRNLRMVGLRGCGDELRAEQIDALRAGMQTITEVQLTFEEVVRGLDVQPVFDRAATIHDHVNALATYVGGLVDEWEDRGHAFWVDSQTARVADLVRLQRFLGPAKHDFRPHAATPLGYVEWLVSAELFHKVGAHDRATRAVDQAVSDHGAARPPDPFAPRVTRHVADDHAAPDAL